MRFIRFIISLCCVLAFNRAYCQEDTFSAHVEDATTGMELSFANVYVADGIGTLTNIDGDFTIKTNAETMLRISYVGYETVSVKAGELPKIVKMQPLARSLNEVVVIPVESILEKIEAKLTKDHNRNSNKKALYFYRQLTTTRNKELAEAFIEAKSTVNLRELTSLSGHHGRKTAAGLGRSLIANMNFHHPLELGPMTEGVPFWDMAERPLRIPSRSPYASTNPLLVHSSTNRSVPFKWRKHNYELDILTDSVGKKIYAITFTPKDTTSKQVILSGTIYADASNYSLLSFDGRMEGMEVEISKDFVHTSSPIELDIHVKYRHTRKFTEVENISYTIHSGDLTSHALLFNIDGMNISKKKVKTKSRMKENMLSSLSDKEFEAVLTQNADIVQRTEDELDTAESDNVDNVMATHYNIKGNGAPMKWNIELPDTKPGNLTNRLAKMGQVLPQEKVYVHMDNTSYFIGDSIWFSAYLRQTCDDQISNISGVLYVELLNNDGYLMARKLIDTKNGRGHGAFHIDPEWYPGYYELRAYTRWQLNWGAYEREHAEEAKYWFINKEMERRYFRDYEKLYSRVFPVYDQPKKAGQYNENMTLRELSRYIKDDPDKPKLQLTLYPEGGELIEGVPSRVAYEAAYSNGKVCEGEAVIDNGNDVEPTRAATQSRGRGVFEYTPGKSANREVVFTAKNGERVKAKLPKAEKDGVALQVMRLDSVWNIRASIAGTARNDTLGLTVMHEGRVRHFFELNWRQGPNGEALPNDTVVQFVISDTDLECGVNQATVFDVNGRIFADRLFFMTKPELTGPSLTVSGMRDDYYQPYEKISLNVSMNRAAAKAATGSKNKPSGTISLSVRDKDTSNNLFDNGSIQAEMLLASEIKGFVPSPNWFFQKDDDEHRNALDLLMMTQGWRRFNWRHMAVRGEWDLTQPDERTPVVTGNIYTYWPGYFYHPKDLKNYLLPPDSHDIAWTLPENENINPENPEVRTQEDIVLAELESLNYYEITDDVLAENLENERTNKKKLKHNVRVHSELVQFGEKTGIEVETDAVNGKFRLTLPRFYNESVFFLSASDTVRWKKGRQYDWVQKMPDEFDWRKVRAKDGEFSIRVDHPYPRFVKPYNYYQQQINYLDEKMEGARTLEDGTRQLGEVKVKAKRRRYSALVDSIPAFMVDGYEAYNFALDAGMLSSNAQHILRAYVGDYGLNKPYCYESPRADVKPSKTYRLHTIKGANTVRRSLKDATLNVDSASMRRNLLTDRTWDNEISRYEFDTWYGNLSAIEKYVIYTDYQPRHIGSIRYAGSNLPHTYIAVCPYADDSRRIMYRDRRFILPGIAWPEEFYHPDYSNRELPAEPADYRRTLYWNPDLRLDSEGKATVTFWNNSRKTRIAVSAEGVAANGQVLTNK